MTLRGDGSSAGLRGGRSDEAQGGRSGGGSEIGAPVGLREAFR